MCSDAGKGAQKTPLITTMPSSIETGTVLLSTVMDEASLPRDRMVTALDVVLEVTEIVPPLLASAVTVTEDPLGVVAVVLTEVGLPALIVSELPGPIGTVVNAPLTVAIWPDNVV